MNGKPIFKTVLGAIVVAALLLGWHCFRLSEFCHVRGSFQVAWFPNGRPGTITVDVRNLEGLPVLDASVAVTTSSGSTSRRTNEDGMVSMPVSDQMLLGLQVNDHVLLNRPGVFASKPMPAGLDVFVRIMQ